MDSFELSTMSSWTSSDPVGGLDLEPTEMFDNSTESAVKEIIGTLTDLNKVKIKV